MINIWEKFNFNEPLTCEVITKVGDVILPMDYLEFMKRHNGGEGDVGSAYVVLYRMEELQEINEDYGIEKFMPHNCLIGTDGGGELFGIDVKGNYFTVPAIMNEEDKRCISRSLDDFMRSLNEFFHNR